MPIQICGFSCEYRWLSNFWFSPIVYKGDVFPTLEHAYQAQKAINSDDFQKILHAFTPSKAKNIAKNIPIRADWDEVKFGIMSELLHIKFKKGTTLAKALVETGDAYLEETNWWGDTFWGVCNGKGENNLGKLLMQIREELINDV